MIEVDSDHRLHSPAESLLTGFHEVMTVEETAVKSYALFGDFTNEFIIGKLDPTTLDHLIAKFAHESNVSRLARKADVVDLAKDRGDLFHALIIQLCEPGWRALCATSWTGLLLDHYVTHAKSASIHPVIAKFLVVRPDRL